MKVRIGYFDERSALELTKTLKSIGVGAEVRKCISVTFVPTFVVEGRFSELRNKYEETELVEDIKEWKNRLEMAGKIGSLDELRKKLEKEYFEIILDMIELNGMLDGDIVNPPPEDPIIRFPVETDEERAKKLDLKRKLMVISYVDYEVFAELGHAIFNDKLNEICEEKGELISLLMMAGMAERILEDLADASKDLDELRRVRRIPFGDSVELRVSSDVIDGVLESLESMGLVKIKKGKVQLKQL